MKWLIIIIVLLAITYLVRPKRPVKVIGSFSDLSELLRDLMTANNPKASLIADFMDSPHFIQFSGDEHGIQVSMPLLTKAQISTKADLEKVCLNAGFASEINARRDGSQAVGCHIKGNPEKVISTIEKITAKVFDVKKDDSVKFTLEGFNPNVTPNP